jgi:hypothetical protein
MPFRRERRQAKSTIGPDTDVFILDVTEQWYDDQHSYWAFTDPLWYEWATSDEATPPPWLEKMNAKLGEHLPASPTRTDRILFLYHVAVMLRGGHFIGSEPSELAEWLGPRQPLGVLAAVEATTPFAEDED